MKDEKDSNAELAKISLLGGNEWDRTNRISSEGFIMNVDGLAYPRMDTDTNIRSGGVATNGNGEATSFNNNNDGFNDNGSFNFISTESRPVPRNSGTDPHAYTRSQIPGSTIETDYTSKFSSQMNTKCTVIRGHMTVYTYDATAFENLDVRILQVFEEDMNSPMVMKELFLSNVVFGVRFLSTQGGGDAGSGSGGDGGFSSQGSTASISGGLGHVSEINGPLSSSKEDYSNSGYSSFSFPMMVLIALGLFLVVLSGLFVYTSKRSDRKTKKGDIGTDQISEDGDGVKGRTYYQDSIEMDLKAMNFDNESTSSARTIEEKSSNCMITCVREEYGQNVESKYIFTTYGRDSIDESSHTGKHESVESEGYGSSDFISSPGHGVKTQPSQQLYQVYSYDDDENYSIHSIRSANQSVSANTSFNNPLAVLQFGEDESVSRSNANGSLTSSRPSQTSSSVFLRTRSTLKRYVGMPTTNEEGECNSVAREAYVDEKDVNEYDPNSMGMEVSLTPNFWNIRNVLSFV